MTFGSCRLVWLLALLLVVTAQVTSAAPITIDTALVTNPGNADDTTGWGGVAYQYRIGIYEVTNDQYAAFLNAKASSDPLGLFSTSMASDPRGGISRTGVSGSFAYAARPDMGNKPVNFVSWYDAVRFTNWLHNGQGSGDTETGAYTLLGGTATPSNGLSVTRNLGAKWWLPSMDEWHKSAYHQPASQGGDSDNYWLYPTASNLAPTPGTAIDLVGPTRGDIANPGANVANYNSAADWNGQDGNVTTVGSAGPLSKSFYGTFDQGANVREWIEDVFFDPQVGTWRRERGGSFNNGAINMQSGIAAAGAPGGESANRGFRVAAVPEPSARLLACVSTALGIACGYFRARGGKRSVCRVS
jgi:formylglycine-generating enzyme required for sulfatase activity